MDLNRVIVTGRLVADPELRYLPNGTAMTTFTLAINEGLGKNKQANFIRVTCWKKVAESAAHNLYKGSKVLIDGSIRQNRWEGKDGSKRSDVGINAFIVMFLDTKKQEQEYSMDSDSYKDDEF